MKELMEQHFLALTFILVCAWGFGFVSGKWWERTKNDIPPPGDNGIWW
jgi:hypothetical protein